jgi:type VI secretion system secreted protein Hcp
MTRSRALKIAVPVALALGAGTAVAIAAIPGADGTIRACYTTTGSPSGQVRIVDEGVPCATGEQLLTWNQQGPAGAQGPPGPQGDPGLPGDTSGSSGGSDNFNGSTSEPGGPSADIFLKLDGIPGDSTDSAHKGQIDVEAFAYGVKRSGKTRVATFRIDKVTDSSSPKLLADSNSGRHIKSAVITFRQSGSDPDTEFLTYKLTDVVVSSYQEGGANPDAKALGSLEEEVGLTAARAQVTERSTNAKGQPGAPVSATLAFKRAK